MKKAEGEAIKREKEKKGKNHEGRTGGKNEEEV